MAIANFISTVWTETLARQLDKEYVGVANCSREFEGIIKGKGSTVKICSVGNITISDYTKNSNMNAPQTLSDTARALIINQAKAFNFQIDDVDAAQSSPRLMELAMSQAAAALADVADSFVYSLYANIDSSQTVTEDALTAANVVDTVIKARQKLLANGVSGSTATSLEVTPDVAALLLKAQIMQSTDNSDSFKAGMIGKLVGFDVYVSSNVVTDASYNKCIARTKRAIAFAEQLNEIEAYRPESRFADAVKGLHLYGAKIVYPEELVLLNVKI